MKSQSIKKMLFALATGCGLISVVLITAFYLLTVYSSDIVKTNEAKFNSYLLADELRQSSDDLTRLGRVFVVTGDKSYEEQYLSILDIRNGKKPRPEEYHRIYWDFVAGGEGKPRPDGDSIALVEGLMKNAGFSEHEFDLLQQAANNSNELVNLEVEAMNIVHGKFLDSEGNYSIERDPSREELQHAAQMLHSKDYHTYKSNIMGPIDQFFVEMGKRTQQSVILAEENTTLWRWMTGAGMLLLFGFLVFAVRVVVKRVLNPMYELQKTMNVLASGDTSVTIPCLDKHDELGEMARALEEFRKGIVEKNESAEENKRIKTALDGATNNIMLVNSQCSVTYVNESLLHFMGNVERDLKKSLPNFSTDNLMGADFGDFLDCTSHSRLMLDSISSTKHINCNMGDLYLVIALTPVYGHDGQRVGTVAEWEDRTQQLETEQEIQHMVNCAKSGDLTQRISLENKTGFLHRLSVDVNDMVDVTENTIKDAVISINALSGGDLTRVINTEYKGLFGQLKEDVNATAVQLTSIVSEICNSSESVSMGADDIESGIKDLSSRTEQQASHLGNITTNMDTMTSSVYQNADNADRASQLSAVARSQAVKGGAVVAQAVSAMNEITDSSKQISTIISVINDIAFQTNLLALNAAVEAARAGEQGRGFAVVASEVRSLAGRSAKAANEIKTLIQDSQQKVEEGSRLVNDSGHNLESIVESVKQMNGIIMEITQTSQIQTDGIKQVSQAMLEMDDMTQQNAALVEQASAYSMSMSDQAKGLSQLMQFFTLSEPKKALPSVNSSLYELRTVS